MRDTVIYRSSGKGMVGRLAERERRFERRILLRKGYMPKRKSVYDNAETEPGNGPDLLGVPSTHGSAR